jgi:oxalate decarboxylase
MMDMQPTHRTKAGEVRIVDSNIFQASTAIAAAHVIVHPGGLRELHWHQNADEWQYYVAGKGRMTVFAAHGNARTMDSQDVSLNQWLTHLPPGLVQAHLNIDLATINAIPHSGVYLVIFALLAQGRLSWHNRT